MKLITISLIVFVIPAPTAPAGGRLTAVTERAVLLTKETTTGDIPINDDWFVPHIMIGNVPANWP